jgi:hypothetical protein
MENREWVDKSLSLLEPPEDWTPNARIAAARVNARHAHRSTIRTRAVRYAMAMAAIAVLGFFLLPSIPKAIAQTDSGSGWFGMERLWDYFMILHLNPPMIFRPQALPESVRELERRVFEKTASRETGAPPSIPRAPRKGVVGTQTTFSIAPISIDANVGTGGVGNMARKGWPIHLRTGAISVSQWGAASLHGIDWLELTFAQGSEPEITGPAGFDLREFTTAIVQTYRAIRGGTSSGFQIHSGDRLLSLPALAPALIIGSGSDDPVMLSEANLKAAPATLVQFLPNPPDDRIRSLAPLKIGRFALLWISSGQIFLLSGEPATLPAPASPASAQTIESLIEIANSIR